MSTTDTQFQGEESILDRIIASKEDKEKESFNPIEVIDALLHELSSKESDVLRRRFGLHGKAKETLEAIGEHYNVTRERIRQIENLAVQKIKDHKTFQHNVKPMDHVLLTVLEEHGGIMSQQHFLDELFPLGRTESNDQAVLFLLGELLDYRFQKVSANSKFVKSWRLAGANMDFVLEVITHLQDLIKDIGNPLSLDELYSRFQKTQFYQHNAEKLSDSVVLSYLEVSKKIGKNPFDEYGLARWGSVLPKRMNDKIYLVLKKLGEPMHFVDIAKEITKVFGKKAYPPTVHNELILNKKYVLVGRGIYALKEWGFKRGVVADVLEEILREQGEPLKRSELVDRVLQQRIVKKNTIHLALTNKDRFKKLPNGYYALVEGEN